jgi:MFS family permease
MTLAETFRPLRAPTYRQFFIGQLTSAFGDGMVTVALAFAVLDVTGSTAALGWVLGIRSALTIAALLLGGAVADRFSQRPVMVVADVMRFASQALLAALLFAGTAELWQILVLYAIHGACSGFFYPAVTALAPQLVPQSQLQQANALRWAADAAGGVAGPAVAGFILAAATPAWAIAGDSVSFAVSAVALVALSLPMTVRVQDASLLRQLVEGWQAFASRSWLWIANIQAAATNAARRHGG